MIVTIEDQAFDTDDITQLYPAAMIKTGYNEEVTQISLEWVDMQEGNSDVTVVNYAIFIHKRDRSVASFPYHDREALQVALDALASQIQD
jgi:hypothetical protein